MLLQCVSIKWFEHPGSWTSVRGQLLNLSERCPGGCRIAPQHSGKNSREVTKSCCQTSESEIQEKSKEAEDDTRGGEISSLARVINFTMPQNVGPGARPKTWHSPAPEKQFIKQKPPLTQSLHLSSLPLSSLPSLPLPPLFSFTRLNSKKWMIRKRESIFKGKRLLNYGNLSLKPTTQTEKDK